MRSLLDGSKLGPEYWSWALIHAVYLKNRLPHRALNKTPYQACTGNRPDITKLRIFGSPVVCCLPGKRPAKLDTHAASGTFLGFTATENNIYYQDHITKHIKVATHVTFNEAGYTLPPGALSHTQCILQDLHGNRPEIQQDATLTVHDSANDTLAPTFSASADATPNVQVKLLTPHGRLPTRATKEAAGLDVYSAADISIPPQQTAKIPLDIAITPPEGTYCQLLSRSGLFSRNNVEVKIGTIDRDYTGNVMVVLQNNDKTNPYHVTQGELIAQLILYRIATPLVVQVNEISPTERGTGSFGSTGCGIINDAAQYHDPSALCRDSSTNRDSGHTLPSHNLKSNAH
jgi:dUTP pyrophosphatase